MRVRKATKVPSADTDDRIDVSRADARTKALGKQSPHGRRPGSKRAAARNARAPISIKRRYGATNGREWAFMRETVGTFFEKARPQKSLRALLHHVASGSHFVANFTQALV
jgi:hypothetical protein